MNRDDRGHWVVFAVFLVSTLATVGVGVFGVGVGLLALLETGSLVATLSALLPWAVGTLVLLFADTVLFVWAVVAALRRLSLPRDDRLAALAERAESTVPGLRSLSLAERFEPTLEQRRAALRERYLAGEITEAEFERRVVDYLEAPGPEPTTDPVLAEYLEDLDAGSTNDRSESGDAAARERRPTDRERDLNVEVE